MPDQIFPGKVLTGSPVVLIPGKPVPELPPEVIFIVSPITVKSTVMEKNIISMDREDSGGLSNENVHQKEE